MFFPHSRGWSCWDGGRNSIVRVFPALAGVILSINPLQPFAKSFSRTCGGDPISMTDRDLDTLFFPHSRRWSRFKRGYICHRWVFPAHAGVIPDKAWQWCLRLSFSRTRGGDPRIPWTGIAGYKFFPHTRGWSQANTDACIRFMVFPAHAGVIPVSKTWRKHARSFSRIRGGDPKFQDKFKKIGRFFPHTRGWSRWCK